MKDFFKKAWAGIRRELLMFWVSSWFVIASIILGIIAGFIFDWNIAVWVFFGGVISFIAFIWIRSIWWFISGTGDYTGREGWLKRLWNKVSKK